ncbi:hypothetical protein AT6N2_C1722 [Agrobacterium tumefaciens]|nr:hypothetical protein AT6N2_C1722 [Agrobacterium tumefaciens]
MTAIAAGLQCDVVAGPENEQLVGGEDIAGHIQRTGQNIDRPLFMIGGEGELYARLQGQVDIQRVGKGRNGGGEAFEFADHHPAGCALDIDQRHLFFRGVRKSRVDFLHMIGQGKPGLQAGHGQRMAAQVFRRAFRMHDAAPGRHQVDVAGANDKLGAETVAMLDFAVEQIGHRGKPDMRVRLDVERLTRLQDRRPHAVKKDERADKPPLPGRQRPAHGKTANVAGARNDEVLDGVAGKGIARDGVVAGKEGHGQLLVLLRGSLTRMERDGSAVMMNAASHRSTGRVYSPSSGSTPCGLPARSRRIFSMRFSAAFSSVSQCFFRASPRS